MKLPLSWLSDYMTLNIDPKTYADRMTMTGSKVEGYEILSEKIQNVVVGKILTKEKHPNADRLWVTTVDVGSEVLQIVTGAQNINVGDLIPVAKVGAKLPGGITIKAGKLRGVESNGMMCSHDELGLDVDEIEGACEDGILIFQKEYPLGLDVNEILMQNDTVVEFEITSNRPDCFSIIGLARESACSFNVPFNLKTPQVKETDEEAKDYINVIIEDKDLCPRFTARVVKNVKIGPSPLWMQARLKAAGVRPINNIVDITNYVMLEYGQPMHAYDLRDIRGNTLIARRAKDGEVIKTLDEKERVLDSSILVIADKEGTVGVAGVMGGYNSEIKDDTTTVVFEAALFEKNSIRLTAKKLGMRTEASSRFEKGLDKNNTLLAMNRACELVNELACGDVLKGVVDVDYTEDKVNVIKFRPEKINEFLNTNISQDEMVKILEPLGFVVDINAMTITVPSYRPDVEGEADIAEEVARFYGYDKIPSKLSLGKTTLGKRNPRQNFIKDIKTLLSNFGCYEVITYSFINPKLLDMIKADDTLKEVVRIKNPLGEETSIMRRTLIPSIMEVIARNVNQKNKNPLVFETGTVYIPKSLPLTDLPIERQKLAIGGAGEADFYTIKGIVEELFNKLGVKNFEFVPHSENETFHPGKTAKILIDNTDAGILGEIHPDVCDNFDISNKVTILELDIDTLFNSKKRVKTYKPIPKFPQVTRDIAMLVDDSVNVAQIEKIIKKCSGNLLEELTLFDVYKGKQIPEGKKSVAYSAVFRAEDRTLTDDDVNAIFNKIVESLNKELGAQLRAM